MHFLNKEIKQAIITLGGKGRRIKSITQDIPKPLYPINGKSTLERAVKNLNDQGISRFIFFVNYMTKLFERESDQLMKKYNIQINLIKENIPRGEAGSIFHCIDNLDENFLFIHGDIIFDIDLIRFINFHSQKQSDITIVTHLTNHPEDSDCIVESPTLSINKYKFKNTSTNDKSFYLGNAGFALIKKFVIISLKERLKNYDHEISLFKDVVIEAVKNNFNVFSYNTSEYLKDMGTPERLKKAEVDINQNIVSNRSYRSKQRVLFLDRDNTLIKCPEKKYITSKEELIIFEERIKEIAKISKNFDFCLLVTNQPQISMGYVSWQSVIEINGIIINKCQLLDLNIAGVYLCPHHPHANFENEIESLKVSCFCRKPLPGLFFEASYMKNIDLKNSMLIGDSLRDIMAAQNLKMKFKNVNEL
tara:strand:+ start:2237 stop:3493 length:1257 start_codon:yes stop_codon:yes gene_type:complete